ncbi:hypothetical protein QRD38_04505 [Leptospira weilii]|uniref:hypothetical protein n=1 Tax=Leptospira weilii TaxID=28184 RepID=UPI00256F4AB6|nr:hypothetical protein [Leptospira weilii]MDL5245066.1 hypothetical protein [Leptospira weilii]
MGTPPVFLKNTRLVPCDGIHRMRNFGFYVRANGEEVLLRKKPHNQKILILSTVVVGLIFIGVPTHSFCRNSYKRTPDKNYSVGTPANFVFTKNL